MTSEIFKGLYAFPCFVDTHLHILALGVELLTHDLEKEDLRQLLREESSFLFARGWTEIPPLELINSVSYPVLLVRRCGHMAIINDAAKQRLRIHKNVLKEQEMKVLYDLFEVKFYEKALKQAEKELFRFGVSYVHSVDWKGMSFNELVSILRKARIRIYEKLSTKDPKPEMFGKLTERVYIGAIKLFADGSLGARTACMHRPYLDTKERGELLLDGQTLEKILRFGKEHEIEVCIHAIGDAALDFLAPYLERYPGNRVIHAQFVSDFALSKLKETKFSVQPHFRFEDEPLFKYIKTDAHPYPYKMMHDVGYQIWFSSDAPVSPHDPRYGIEAAMKMGFSKQEAIKLYTIGSRDTCYYEKPDPLENLPVAIKMGDGEIIDLSVT